jgi:hypothetical protein
VGCREKQAITQAALVGYIRVAIGFDGQDGAMTRSAHSGGEEKVEIAIRVEQAGAQSQA